MKKKILILMISILIVIGAICYFVITKNGYDSYKIAVNVMGIEKDEWSPMLYLYLSRFMIALSIIGCVIGFNLRYNFKSSMNTSDSKILNKIVEFEEVATIIVLFIQTILIIIMRNVLLTKIALLLMVIEFVILIYPSLFFVINLVALVPGKKKEPSE